jgi:hypothetical protein
MLSNYVLYKMNPTIPVHFSHSLLNLLWKICIVFVCYILELWIFILGMMKLIGNTYTECIYIGLVWYMIQMSMDISNLLMTYYDRWENQNHEKQQ